MGSRNTIRSSYAVLSKPAGVKRFAMSPFRNSMRSCVSKQVNVAHVVVQYTLLRTDPYLKLEPTCMKSSARATAAGPETSASAAAIRRGLARLNWW